MSTSPNTTCLSNQQGSVLSSTVTCLDGFHCPNNKLGNPPEICPPTTQCRLTRLQEHHNICNHAQGTYEPTVCQPGYYCPSGGQSQIPCPKGHFCPLGTVEPFKCFKLSACPEGSTRELPTAGLLYAVLLDIVVVMFVAWPFLSGWIRHRSRAKLGGKPGEPVSEREIECCGRNTPFTTTESSSHVAQFFRPHHSQGAIPGIEVAFRSLSMRPTEHESLTLNRLRDLVALVPQDDIMLPDMTVQENILYSSRIRLGGSRKDVEIRRYVDHLITSLGLSSVRNRLVGEVGGRGLSGGERKRVNIALELAAAPRIIVLDEPTSGLDAKTALSVIELLKSLTTHGVTVICVIHQPRPEIFSSLDDMLLLNRGRQIYFGAAADAKQCFVDAGYNFPVASNSADTMMDILSCYDNIDLCQHKKSSPGSPGRDNRDLRAPLSFVRQGRALWHRQVFLAFMRGVKQQTRQYPSFLLEIVTGAATGLLIGLSNYEFKGHLFQGLFHPPFQLLSSPVSYRLLTEQGMLLCLTIGKMIYYYTT
ncbi:uncharacterized protein N7515_006834 [Penicillium bovifimosum]|uniref:ABC transporter domain-containing protein n=1 Tax=Penicillium bovifimosum TaxID=126998 RepID=A0A9W9GVF6_9EURO|nr:uncharacterized protein N7515_006834 [Penicillium bovifimosum]KAJ5130795.1 hypothetical protein N7515_006834 [Penicillium bovifimosum]